MNKLCFRFSAKIGAFRWLVILLTDQSLIKGKICTHKRNVQKPLGKPVGKRTPPSKKTQLQFCKYS